MRCLMFWPLCCHIWSVLDVPGLQAELRMCGGARERDSRRKVQCFEKQVAKTRPDSDSLSETVFCTNSTVTWSIKKIVVPESLPYFSRRFL